MFIMDAKNHYKVTEKHTIYENQMSDFDKTIVSTLLVIDYRLFMLPTNKYTIDNDTIEDIFNNSCEFQQMFDKYKGNDNVINLIYYTVVDNNNEHLYSYIVFAKHPNIAFILLSLANYKYGENLNIQSFNKFINNEDVHENYILNVVDRLLNVNTKENYAKVLFKGNHHHKTNGAITGIHVKTLSVENVTIDTVQFSENDKKLIYDSCEHINDREKYKTYILQRTLALLHREAMSHKNHHLFTIEILAIHKEVMYSIYCAAAAEEALRENAIKYINRANMYNELYESTKVELTETKTELTETKTELTETKTELTETKTELTETKTENADLKADNDDLRKRIEELTKELEKYKNK